MKRLCYFVLLIVLSSCGEFGKTIDYIKDSTETFEGKQWINYEVVLDQWYNGKHLELCAFNVYSNCDIKNPYYVITDTSTMRSIKVEPYRVFVVDERNYELSSFQSSDSLGLFEQMRFETCTQLAYLSFYFLPLPKEIRPTLFLEAIKEVKDTICRDVPMKKYIGLHSPQMLFNRETNEFDIPLQFESVIWRRMDTKIVDSVICYNITNNDNYEYNLYTIRNLNYNDLQLFVDSIFNFDNPQYSNYSRHTESFPPYSRLGTRKSEIDSSLLNFPIVSLQNDTTNINKEDGFLLLNFWGVGCQPCYENLLKYKQQKDSLGYRILENNGIKIMAINYLSNNNELIAKIGKKTETIDIMYSSKGMREFINIPYIGYYYLFSPDKHVIYETDNLDDYSELLKAKSDYEQQHQND